MKDEITLTDLYAYLTLSLGHQRGELTMSVDRVIDTHIPTRPTRKQLCSSLDGLAQRGYVFVLGFGMHREYGVVIGTPEGKVFNEKAHSRLKRMLSVSVD